MDLYAYLELPTPLILFLASPIPYPCRHSSTRCPRLQKLDPFSRTTIEIAYSLSSYQLITRLVFKIITGPSEIVSLISCIRNFMFTNPPKVPLTN